MDWLTIPLLCLIIALIFASLLRSHFKSEEVHARLDDVIDGVGLFAQEVLKRTDMLTDLAGKVSPAIELHNHNPLEQIFSFVRGMKTGNFEGFGADMNNNPRDSSGQYAATPEEIEDTTPQVIDITD